MSKRFFLSIIPRGEEKIFTAPNTSILPQSKDYKHRADDLRKKLNLDNKKVILYVGRLVTEKGIDYLLEAFAKLEKTNNDVALIVVGGPVGDLTKYKPEELLAKCRDMGVENTHFPGWVYGEDKTIYFMLANVVVLPSIFFSIGSEVWGLVLNEAMSVGKPIIATYAVGAAYDLIENGVNGYIVPDKDSEALFKSIKAIIDNSSTEKNFGEKSKEILFGKFTYEHMYRGFINAVEYAIRTI
jgi:glycosyltransferase involved in cell wall biosynthesis